MTSRPNATVYLDYWQFYLFVPYIREKDQQDALFYFLYLFQLYYLLQLEQFQS